MIKEKRKNKQLNFFLSQNQENLPIIEQYLNILRFLRISFFSQLFLVSIGILSENLVPPSDRVFEL